MKLQPAFGLFSVGAVQKQHVEMNVGIESTAKPLDQSYCAGLGCALALLNPKDILARMGSYRRFASTPACSLALLLEVTIGFGSRLSFIKFLRNTTRITSFSCHLTSVIAYHC